jgi:hypothetical protein
MLSQQVKYPTQLHEYISCWSSFMWHKKNSDSDSFSCFGVHPKGFPKFQSLEAFSEMQMSKGP